MQDVESRQEVVGFVDFARRETLEQRPLAATRLLHLGHERVTRRRESERRPRVRKMNDQHTPFDRGHASGAELRIEAVGQVVPDGPGMHDSDLTGSRVHAIAV